MFDTNRAPVLGENWANISDPVERRRAQNRIAQRGYRKRLREGAKASAEEKTEKGGRGKESAASTTATKAPSATSKIGNTRTKRSSSPPDPKADPSQTLSRQVSIVGPPTPPGSASSLSQGTHYPFHQHQQQRTPPPLPTDFNPFHAQLEPPSFLGRSWTAPPPEETRNQGRFPLSTPIDEQPLCLTPDDLHAPPFVASAADAAALLGFPGRDGGSLVPSKNEGSIPRGHTALHRAALHGHGQVLSVLLRAGADPTIPDNTGLTPLHFAAQNGHAGLVQQLLASTPSNRDLVRQATRMGETALHLAVQARQTTMVQVLLEHAPHVVNDQDLQGRTALHLACESNQQELVDLLVRAGAQLDIRDFTGQTLLHSACMGANL
ncbi:Uncharacterized protein PECH_008712 [Penicillium ucsense]|uniref:BZIP domain-containing protein n=1 Tax=Penicillium ucsense TaxID=2839758 RepID=A0A8J8WJ77_9EURO|nr:Uncharacterized protein PECM_007223 [Penicillium ucsense]KAF7733987.1 Uncharacterized protein PECH_008712 [Penicillium ucsense]